MNRRPTTTFRFSVDVAEPVKGKQAEACFPLFTSAVIAFLLYRPVILAESGLFFTPFSSSQFTEPVF
jgi:hypothetical protein